LDLLDEGGPDAVREKTVALGRFVLEGVDALLADHGVQVLSPRDDDRRGGHVTIGHPRSREVTEQLWAQDIVPDFREPAVTRLGLAPLSPSYGELPDRLVRIETAHRGRPTTLRFLFLRVARSDSDQDQRRPRTRGQCGEAGSTRPKWCA